MLGSAYFVGYSLACLFIPRLADIYGRRWLFIGAIWFQVLVYIGLLFSKSLVSNIILILVFGLCGAGRSTTGYLYLMELLHAKHKRIAGTAT